ncbi:MAG: D-alanyl-lipoteichoic acid biosynthesis protein DltD [Lachnospiraceae bacterium]
MKKFLRKIGIVGTILATLLFLLNGLYINTEYYKTLNGMDRFRTIPEKVQVANFGASHSMGGFVWSGNEFVGWNMANGGQSLVYDEALFQTYLESFDENAVIIIDVMFHSLYGSEEREKPYDSGITRYYGIVDREYMYHWNFMDAICYDYIPVIGNRQEALQQILNQWNLSNIQSHAKEKMATKEETIDLIIPGWTVEEMQEHGKKRATSAMNNEQVLGVEYDALVRMIQLCKEKNFQVILTTVPTLPEYYESFSKEYKERFYKDMETISKEYNVPYIDYTGDERLLGDYSWYLDTDHLNGVGGSEFTKIFLEDQAKYVTHLN